MGGVSDLIGHHRAANAGMFGPAVYARFEEGAVGDQLTAAVEQVEQARLTFGPVELIFLLNCHPRHLPTFGSLRVTVACQLYLPHEKFLWGNLPLLLRD